MIAVSREQLLGWRAEWMEDHPCEDGHDHVTPFDGALMIDALHQQMRDLFVAELKAGIATGSIPDAMDRATDEVFQTCPGGECCDQCASIFCPYGEPLHFHHDGCPCCSSDDIELPTNRGERHIARVRRWRVLLKRNQQT